MSQTLPDFEFNGKDTLKNTAYLVILFVTLGITGTAAFQPQLVSRALTFLGLSKSQSVLFDLAPEFTEARKETQVTYGNIPVFDNDLHDAGTASLSPQAVPAFMLMPSVQNGAQNVGFADFADESQDGFASTTPLQANQIPIGPSASPHPGTGIGFSSYAAPNESGQSNQLSAPMTNLPTDMTSNNRFNSASVVLPDSGSPIPAAYNDQNSISNVPASNAQNTLSNDSAFVNNAFQFNNPNLQPAAVQPTVTQPYGVPQGITPQNTQNISPQTPFVNPNAAMNSDAAMNPNATTMQPAFVVPSMPSPQPMIQTAQPPTVQPFAPQALIPQPLSPQTTSMPVQVPPAQMTPAQTVPVQIASASTQISPDGISPNQIPPNQFQTALQPSPQEETPVMSLNPKQSKYEPEVLAEIEPIFGAALLARVGTESILMCDVLPDIQEMVNAQWIEIVKENAQNYGPTPTLDDERMIKSQFIAHRFPDMLERRIETAMLSNDIAIKAPAEALVPYKQQFVELFNSRVLPNLMKEYQVSNRYELDAKIQKMYGISLERKKEIFVRELLADGWLSTNAKTFEMIITHDDMLEYYNEHKQEYKHLGKARWEELAILFSETPNREEARNRIAGLGNRVVQNREKFSDVAKQGSQGVTAYKGGEWDWCQQGSLRSKELDQAIFSLPVGAMSQIIADDYGFHIIRVIERQDEHYTPFDNLYDQIKKRIETERSEKAKNEYKAELRKKYPPIISQDLPDLIQAASNAALMQKTATPIPQLARQTTTPKNTPANGTGNTPTTFAVHQNPSSTEIATGNSRDAAIQMNDSVLEDRNSPSSKKESSKKSKSWNPLNLFR